VSYKIGIDVGGTFTDLFLWTADGRVESFKVPSTPEDPSIGVLHGMAQMAQAEGIAEAEFTRRTSLIVHGTTVTTNAVLTRKGALTGLVTTDGVRDALEMRRGIREEQYNNRFLNVVPLVPRRLRRAVQGRLNYKGDEICALDLDGVRDAATLLKNQGVTAVAVCFMHSYANPAHEEAAAEAIRSVMPEAYLSISSRVLPTIRFYDRVSSTVLNGFVGPVLNNYIGNLTTKLAEATFDGVLLIMQSNGGVALPAVVQERPATTLLSGPAGGPGAAVNYVATLGTDNCILVDMGGTSFDACLVRNGAPEMNHEGEIDRLRIALPMLAITTIGAGGGSIGWIDKGGLLRMGPESAGAVPGPACYCRGGERPACTDADLLLGYLAPGYFAGGTMQLDVARAEHAIREHVAEPLGVSMEEAAAGMYRVINTNMAHGVREITVKKGLDPREFPMVVAGGAGAVHACEIARELDIDTLLVPPVASTLCAAGMLSCDLQHDFVRSCVGPLDRQDPAVLNRMVDEMAADGEAQLLAEGMPQAEHQVSLDLRYLKQFHEVTVPVDRADLAGGHLEAMADLFHSAHDTLYGYHLKAEGTGLELINIRVRSIGRTAQPPMPRATTGEGDATAALKESRKAYIPESNSFQEVPVYDGHRLKAGNRLPGPSLVERTDTTVFIGASFAAQVDEFGSIVIRRDGTEERS